MPSNEKKPGDESQVQADAASAGAEQAAAAAGNDAASASAAAEVAPDVPKGVAVVKHPDDPKAGASFRGSSYEPDEKGFLVVPLDAVSELVSHGFVMVKEG